MYPTIEEKRAQAKTTTSIVRMTFQSAHRDKIEAPDEWFTATDNLKQEPDIAFVTKGEAIEDELDIVLFISWDYAAKPSASFLSGNIQHIFSPLDDFLAKKPRLICNLYSLHAGQTIRAFQTRPGFETMKEMMVVRGPADVIEATLRKISREVGDYLNALQIGMDLHNICYNAQSFWGSSNIYRVRNEDGGEDSSSEGHADCAAFAIFFQWFSPSRRTDFQDPNIPDRAIPHVFEKDYGSDWWQEEVVKPLEEVGAAVSSWTYHKGEIALDLKGKERLVISKFKNWLQFGYMDLDSLAQLAEKNQHKDQC
ncbi:hypothetical protein ACQKWADRAFT_289925 [Trichoderma austrokoningii]